jgi:hypothetical protein
MVVPMPIAQITYHADRSRARPALVGDL